MVSRHRHRHGRDVWSNPAVRKCFGSEGDTLEALREVAVSNADGPARSDVDELARRISTLEGRHDGYDVFIGTLAVIAVTIAAVALGVAVHVLHRPTASAVGAPRTAATSAHVDVTVTDYRVDVANRLSPGK